MVSRVNTLALVDALRDAGEDFEWYPTTRRMIEAVRKDLREEDCGSILDIGAGDGRVLAMLAETHEGAKLYAIEKATLLQQAQPDRVIPVGTEFFEQDLMSLPVDVTFCNPPYGQFEEWAERVISTAHTGRLYLVLPQRWEGSVLIAEALKARAAAAKVIHTDDFLDADRRARAVVHIIRVIFDAESVRANRRWNSRSEKQDPFDLWFDQNISTFDREAPVADDVQDDKTLARLRDLDSITDLVEAFDEEYARMQDNYKAIFRLDQALLKELGVGKESVREGLKKRMTGLKHTYWQALFEHLGVVTDRLTTKTKQQFLERVTGQTAIAFTISNAYAVVLWAIKAANQYFDAQVVDVFRQLSTFDGVANYVSNQRTWERDKWRYHRDDADKPSHYKLDYRIVLEKYRAIHKEEKFSFGAYDYPGHLHKDCHEVIDDLIAVSGNLGFLVATQIPKDDTFVFSSRLPSRRRQWASNAWQDFKSADGEIVFQVKGFINGNLHLRFRTDVIKALNIEAGRLLGWIRTPADAVTETGCTADEAERFFGSNQRLGASAVRLLAAAPAEKAVR